MKAKKILILVLSLAMILSIGCLSAFAEETTGTIINEGGASFTGDNVVFDGKNYYTSLSAALEGVHGTDNAVLYCKTGADVGTMTHGHVCKNLTVYGNGAYISGGEQEFELDTYTQYGGITCSGITSEIELNVDNLKGAGAWGQRKTSHTINLVFTNCKDMGRIYFTGTSGDINLTMTDCTFTSNTAGNCKVYSNANGTITLNNVDFSNVDVPVNLNHKVSGTQSIILKDCDFDTCGTSAYEYAAPIRVLSSVEGAVSELSVEDCSFANTIANAAQQNADILLDYGVGTTTADISGTGAEVGVEKEANTAIYTTVTASETITATNTEAVVGAQTLTFAEFVSAVISANGTYDGANATVEIKPTSGRTDGTNSCTVPDRLQKYSNPEVYYAQYQRFSELTDISISNVKFVFVPAAVTVTDAWNPTGYTTTADNINGEIQLENSGKVTLKNCTFDKVSVSPINAASVDISGCKFSGLDAYAVKDIKASSVSVVGTTFTDCNGGFWMSAAPATLTVTDNTFTGVGRRGAMQFSSNGDYSNTVMTVTGNNVSGGAFLWQLNSTVTYEQVSAILDVENNTYGEAYVEGSTEPKASVAKTLPTENVLIQNMAQGTTTNENGDTVPTYRVGCFAAIDSANYSALGIEVRADGGKVTGSGTTQYLYTYINVTNAAGEVQKILPETLGETNKYIFGRIMAFTTNYTDFSFRPFAVSLDGKTTLYGSWSKEYTVDPQ